jgi:hypothetical protein
MPSPALKLPRSPLSLVCPFCKARPGKDCITRFGHLSAVHVERIKAAARKDTHNESVSSMRTLQEVKEKLRALMEKARKLREHAQHLQAQSEALTQGLSQKRERTKLRKPAGLLHSKAST